MHRLAPFDDAPAKVVAATDAIDELPQFPTDVADPQLSGAAIEAHLPRIAQAVGPRFAASACKLDEWIIGGNGVRAAILLPSHIDPQDFREQRRHVLARVVLVGRKRRAAVARRDIETAIRPK